MKYKGIILVGLFLLILTSGVVSASDNIQDNMTSMPDAEIIADDDEQLTEYVEGTGSQNSNLEVNWPGEIKVGENYPVTFSMPEDMKSNVCLFVNNERVDDGQQASNNVSYDVFLDNFGTYNLKFKFYGDDKYAPVTKEKSYRVSDFKFNAEVNENLTYGQDAQLTVSFPYDMTGSIKVGSINYAIGEDDFIVVPLRNLQIGTNQIQIAYSGDEKYPAKSIKVNVKVGAEVVYSPMMSFDDVAFNLRLPSDASGDLEITVDGNNKKVSRLVNGNAQISFDGLALGNHTFRARYTGNYVCTSSDEMHFEVIPKIIINSFKTTKDDNSIEIRLPEGETGKLEVKALRYLQEYGGMHVEEISKSANAVNGTSISLPSLNYGYYTYDVRYTSNKGLFSKHAEGYVKDEFEMNITAPNKVLVDENFEIAIDYPGTNDASIEMYVDGNKYGEYECSETGFLKFAIGLKAGTHTITAKFSGNERYAPLTKSLAIQSAYVFFNIPDGIVIGSDDAISLRAVKSATGYLVVYVDGAEFKRQTVSNGAAVVDMSSLSFENHNVRVLYENGNYPSFSETKVLNVSYTFKMVNGTIHYGDDALYRINAPYALSKDKLIVKIDDAVYPFTLNGNEIAVNVSGLGMGLHAISLSYLGDSRFHPISIENTISVDGKINVPSQASLGQEKYMSLVLPQNPQGKLVVSKYNPIYKTYDVIGSFGFVPYGNNAIAKIPLSYLGIGENNIKIIYSGSDYNVSDVFTTISINLDLAFSSHIQWAKKSTLTINLPGAGGSVDVYIDDEFSTKANFVNGIAKIEFSNLAVGQHNFELTYNDDYSFEYEGQLLVYPQISVPVSVVDGAKSIIVNSNYDPVGSIIIYENGRKVKEVDLDGGRQSISLDFLENGNHRIAIAYDGWDGMVHDFGTYQVNVKKASIRAKDMSMKYLDKSKYKVLIKDYKGKAVKKGQTVKFYVDGKLFKKVKTDSKGYASVVFTHAPGKHTIKIVYKATTVTKKLTVKQILKLKKVNVKKSAKKLVLTATLKKVKGKYLKNKKITFKFNGKKYAAKTNKNGVAKVTIPSKTLKKLKVGKNVSYQATYLKATVKHTVKVKK